MEIEIKYLVEGNLADVERALQEVFPEIEYSEDVSLPAIYYDTKKGNLEKNKVALRVRTERENLVGCFKATTGLERVFIEDEVILTDEDINENNWFTRLEHWSILKEKLAGEEVYPLLKIDTQRKIYNLTHKDIKVEIVLDWVNYLENQFFEERLEVELKKGTQEEFMQFVQYFEKEIKGLIETDISKYQRAKELMNKLHNY